MAQKKLPMTYEWLCNSDHPQARVWRFLREQGKGTQAEITGALGVDRRHIHRLVHAGWARKTGEKRMPLARAKHERASAHTAVVGFSVYEANMEQVKPVPKPPSPQRVLTKIAMKADDARKSGLPSAMGKALLEIAHMARVERERFSERK